MGENRHRQRPHRNRMMTRCIGSVSPRHTPHYQHQLEYYRIHAKIIESTCFHSAGHVRCERDRERERAMCYLHGQMGMRLSVCLTVSTILISVCRHASLSLRVRCARTISHGCVYSRRSPVHKYCHKYRQRNSHGPIRAVHMVSRCVPDATTHISFQRSHRSRLYLSSSTAVADYHFVVIIPPFSHRYIFI